MRDGKRVVLGPLRAKQDGGEASCHGDHHRCREEPARGTAEQRGA